MPRFPRRILFAADGSVESDRARERVVDLLADHPAELHVVHVGLLSPWTNPTSMNPGQLERLREDGQQVLDRQVHHLTAAGVTPTEVHLVLGRATDEVLRLRDEVGADLIVIGSRGLNAFTRVLLGSDAEGIARHAPCAVLIVRDEV